MSCAAWRRLWRACLRTGSPAWSRCSSGATAAAVMAGGEAALADELRRMSGFYRDVGDLLRQARAAGAERSR